MTSIWWRRLAVLWALLALAATGYVVERFWRGAPVKTDIMALLPPTERNPTAEAAVQALSSQLGNRAVLLVGHPDMKEAIRLARDVGARLRASGAFAQVTDTIPDIDARALVDVYKPYRASLLAPADRELLSREAPDMEGLLLRRLHQPFRLGIGTEPREDPFGFLQRWLSGLPLASSRLMVEDGLLTVRDGTMSYALLAAEPRGSAFDGKVQARVVDAVAAAERALRVTRGAVLLRTGAVFYADAARRAAQSEVDLIGGGSLIGILLMMWLLFRSLQPLLLGMLTVGIGVACGMAAILALQGEVHLITIVFGASLIGEAVDYAIQYFAARLNAGPTWDPRCGLRRILPGLRVALATSLVGYGALCLTPFPAISQIALFAFAGLAAAWISVTLLLPWFVTRPARQVAGSGVRLPQRMLACWHERVTPRTALALCVAVAAACVPGWMALQANDDVRQLVSRPAALVEQEATIRRLAAGEASSRFFLVEGANDEEALTREETLAQRLRAQAGQHIAGVSAVSDFVPSQARQRADRTLLERVLPPLKVEALFAQYGFREETGKAWHQAFADQPPLTLVAWRETKLAAPVRHQVLHSGLQGTALLLTLRGDDGSAVLADAVAGLPGVTLVDKSASVSALFAEYRRLAAYWIPAAMAIILALLAWRYGLRQGAAILLPTLLAMAAALAAHGYAAASLTLFTMMGLMLVLGVGVNYAIFLVEAGDRAPVPFAGVLLSAATTILSFGLLCLSGMPALQQFGLVLLIGVACSVLLAPVALTLGKDKA